MSVHGRHVLEEVGGIALWREAFGLVARFLRPLLLLDDSVSVLPGILTSTGATHWNTIQWLWTVQRVRALRNVSALHAIS